jgi:hypothetical protein
MGGRGEASDEGLLLALGGVNCLRVKGPLWGTKRTSASGAPMSPNDP